jgi:hypothetical protein
VGVEMAVHGRQSTLVLERPGQPLGLPKIGEDWLKLAQRRERTTKVDAGVDARLLILTRFGALPEPAQRLFEPGDSLTVRRARGSPGAGRSCVGHSPLPDLGADRVMRQPLGLLLQASGVHLVDRVDDAGVERLAPLLEQATVGDLVRQRVLERVLQLREQAGFVQKLGCLEPSQPAP